MLFPNAHTHHSSENPCEIVSIRPYENTTNYFSVGIHPWFISDVNLPLELAFVDEKSTSTYCLAIGECGLDTVCNTDFNVQKKAFQAQIELAKKHNKPIVIHNVRSHIEIQKMLLQNQFSQAVVFHGFVYKESIATFVLQEKNNVLSFGKALLHNESTQKTFISIPNNRFLLETDDDAISIEEIYHKAAELKQIELELLMEIQHESFRTVFGVSPKNM